MCIEEINQSDGKRFYTFDSLPNVIVPSSSNIVIRTDDGTTDDIPSHLRYEVLPTMQTTMDDEDEEEAALSSSSSPPPPTTQQHTLNDEKQIINRNKKRPAHMQPQQDTQRFPCPRCGRDYSQSKNMRRHFRLECGQEPRYPCNFCQLRFKRNNQLKNHVMIKHCFSNAQSYNN